ncbi:MAG: hypothetical protein FD123_2133 [Bacteroidetes bacterium]|nr:MAG: hypothetical protein FD123_2133 [Bacteroidota bacterium]
MKKFYVLLIFLLPVSILPAQQYRCFQQSDTTWYEYHTGMTQMFQAIHIDSVAALSGDSAFYNYKVAIGSPANSTCFTMDDTTWMGAPSVRRVNGNEIFYNDNGDSIVIKPQAAMGNSWRLLELGGGNYLEATVSGIASQSVLNQTGNVKTITIQAKDISNMPMAHMFNGKTIQVSEDYGFVRIYHLRYFPGDTSAYTIAGKTGMTGVAHQVTAADIFDFNIGEQFDYHGHERTGMPPNQFVFDLYTTNVLTAKQVNGNSITYTWSQTYCKKMGTTIITSYANQPYVETVYTGLLDTTAYLDKLPEEHVYPLDTVTGNYMDEYSFFFYQPAVYNGRLQRNYGRIWPYGYAGQQCWSGSTVSFGPCDNIQQNYVVGLGLAFTGASPFYCNDNRLVYFQKGIETWGTPNDWPLILGEKDLSLSQNTLKLYPVPAEDQVTLQMPFGTNDRTIRLYDAAGRLLDVTNWPSGSLTRQLNVAHLPAGVYRVAVDGPEGRSNAMLVR